MLRRLRKARFGQIVLVIASILAITGSLGLHPEPGRVSPATPTGFVSGAGPPGSGGGAHDCLACLLLGCVALPRLTGEVLAPDSAVAILLVPRAGRPRPAQSRTYEGRAPPALG